MNDFETVTDFMDDYKEQHTAGKHSQITSEGPWVSQTI